MSKVVGTYTGRFDVYQKSSNIKIQIISVPKQKNKIVMTGHGSLKNINGSLLGMKKLIHDEKSLGWDLKPTKMYGVSIAYQSRGSHQGGPMHNFKNHIALFSKDEKHIDKLLKFLEKHITKKKVRRTSKKYKKGGCGKGGGKKTHGVSKKDKTLKNKYKKISKIDCAKKYPKSRDKTLKCLDQKEKDLKSLESEFPEEMKSFKRELKEYEKTMNTFMKEANDCKKHSPDMNKVKKCAEELGKKYNSIFRDNKELSQIYTNNLRDKLHRMIDHTQKVDLGELGKLNL